MSLNNNPAVRKAYEDRTYTDARGNQWRRGMDGWFLDNVDGKGGVMLCRHGDFVELVEKEHPHEPTGYEYAPGMKPLPLQIPDE